MKIKSNKGVTLTELMSSIVIISMTVFSLIGVLVNMNVLNELNRERTLAVVHAQHIMEEIKDSHFTGLEMIINNGGFNLSTGQLSTAPYNFLPLPNESIITSIVSSGNPLRIEVRVNWLAKGVSSRAYTLESLKTNGS